MPKQRKVTQKEIAQMAKVSQALVSRVLNGGVIDIAEGTRRQIMEAAKTLGYTMKKKQVRSLRQKVIAYVRPFVDRGHHQEHWIYDSYDQYFNEIQNYLLEAAIKAGYSLVVRPSCDPDELSAWLKEWDVDGIIWHNEGQQAQWITECHPTVQLFRHPFMKADGVTYNQEEAVVLAMEYLYNKGHRNIIAPIHNISGNVLQLKRYRAYLDFIQSHDLPNWQTLFSPEESDAWLRKDTDWEKGVQIIKTAIDKNGPNAPTAMLIGDHGALFYLTRLQAEGIAVPEQFSIVGIDNISASGYSTPPLTTIDNNLKSIAQEGIALLLWRIKNRTAPYRKLYITPHLIERGSAAAILPFAAPPLPQKQSALS